jgi:hypothetical protein
VDLAADEGEAHAEFEQEFLDVRQQGVFDRPLVGVVAQVEEIEDVGILGDLLSEVGLRRGSVALKFVTALPCRVWRPESIWRASTSPDQPCSTALAAYQRRSITLAPHPCTFCRSRIRRPMSQ